MKYPASKHYSHLNASEPIPEIELRYNESMRAGFRAFARYGWWAIALIFASQASLYVFVGNKMVGILLSLVIGFGVMMFMLSVVGNAQRKSGKVDPLDAWGVPIGEQIRYWVFYVIVMWSVFSGSQIVAGSIMGGLASMFWYTLPLGLGFAVCGRYAREPGQISCMHCDYPIVGLQLPCVCPECGAQLSHLSDATDRPRVRDMRMVLIGLIIAGVSVVTLVMRFYRPPVLYTAMPRSVLVQLAPVDANAFDSLVGTALSAEEQSQLVLGMYQSRVGFGSGSSYEQETWFADAIKSGWLTTDQLDDLYSEYVQVEVDSPKRVRVGEPVDLTLRADYVRTAQDVWYFFSGFQFDEDPSLHARMTSPLSRTFIVGGSEPEHIERGYAPVHRWVSDQPGTYRVRARMIFALGSGYTYRNAVTWTEEGTPEYPKQPIWSCVVDLEHTIEVVE